MSAVDGGRRGAMMLALLALALLAPFAVALLYGQGPGDVLANAPGNPTFLQGLAIEIVVLALYALSFDLLLGVAGLLSVGHSMFFAVGAYGSAILLRSFEWGFGAMLIGVFVAALAQALLFWIVLLRVQGIPFALVTLGFSTVFFIVVSSSDLSEFTGGDVGLHDVPIPNWIDSNEHRYRVYALAVLLLAAVYWAYRRLLRSEVGSVMVAIRENPGRASAFGYRVMSFALIALVVSSITAATAGTLHTIHQPIVTPSVASLGWSVAALLMVLIGGVGTLSGAIVGAVLFRLMQFYLDRWFGSSADLVVGAAYVVIVLFLPSGVVGAWRAQRRGPDNDENADSSDDVTPTLVGAD